MKGISDMTDYFVVCHGNNERQVQSIEISKRTVLFLISKDITVYGTTISCLNYYNYSDQRIRMIK